MKERVKTIICAALISISVAVITWLILDSWHYANPEPKTMQIVDKYEANGKCYIQTWIEITPEEYIGYDVGDEYEEKQ